MCCTLFFSISQPAQEGVSRYEWLGLVHPVLIGGDVTSLSVHMCHVGQDFLH